MVRSFTGSVLALSLGLSAAFGAVAEGDAAAGESKAAVCAGCHGPDGNSAIPNFPKIAGQGERYLLKQLKDVKSGERVIVEMTGILDNFSEQDLADLAAYYASNAQTGGVAAPENLDLGQSLYMAGNQAKGVPACTGCHGPAGAGVEAAGFPRLAGQHGDYIAGQLKKFRAGERDNDDSRMMRQIAANLSDDEIAALANYINGLYK